MNVYIMNWDWDKLQEKRKRQSGYEPPGKKPPDFDSFGRYLEKFKNYNFPMGKLVIGLVIVVWLISGFYTVQPAEEGVVLRFGAFNRITEPGLHYHWPFPLETVETPNVDVVRRVEVGFRSVGGGGETQSGQVRIVPEESLMLTGDENIVNVQFIVQYRIKDPKAFLFNVAGQADTVKSAAEAAMREVIGYNKIDAALTTDKLQIQNDTRDLLQTILDDYSSGMLVTAVQMQDVHPPKEVVDAFKDVASAREDRSRLINEADAYRNDLLPRTRGKAAQIVNQAQAYNATVVRQAMGNSDRFLALLEEYNKAKDVTRERLFIEAMERIFSNPNLEKVILSGEALEQAVPYLPLDRFGRPGTTTGGPRTGGSQ
jgi:membrane protease subunit HflK